MFNKTILLTGGTGFLGKEVIRCLIDEGFCVRVLTRNPSRFINEDYITYVKGDILDLASLKKHITGCYGLIHAAGEKSNIENMEAVNVLGSKNICDVANESGISHFCYLSSVGVIGLTNKKTITENTVCKPTNFYEKTKLEGELYFLNNFNLKDCSSVILRPTNVFGKAHIQYSNSLFNKIKRIIKGNEIANYIYVKDVAYACVYFLDKKNLYKEIFILNDTKTKNNFKDIEAIATNSKVSVFNAPIVLPWVMRYLKFGKNNLGNKYYSNVKLMASGFKFKYGLKEGVKDALKN